VDPILCIGCKKCTSKGPDGSFLDGCPWDAIVMVDTTEVEKEVGVMTY
jgi:ferredoxin